MPQPESYADSLRAAYARWNRIFSEAQRRHVEQNGARRPWRAPIVIERR